MPRIWVCLAARAMQDAVRNAVIAHSPGANAVFVESASELRSWAKDAAPGCHVAVGPLEDGMSSLNVAAAVVRDGGASEVVLVVDEADDRLAERAALMGAHAVLELDGGLDPAKDIDEPNVLSDDIPTFVMDVVPKQRKLVLPEVPEAKGDSDLKQVITSPNDAEDRAKAVETERRKTSIAHEPSAGLAPIIVLVSGRGGVGKTSVTAAMAYAAASWGMRVAACDLDLSCGNLYSCFGTAGPADLGQLFAGASLQADALRSSGQEVSKNLVVWGPCERPEMADAVYPHVEQLLTMLAEQNDLVLVDSGTTFTDAVAQAVQQCDRLVLVVDGRPGSAAAQARLGGLAVRLGVARTRIARLANRCGKRGRGEPSINRAEVGLETARPLRVLDGGSEVADCMAEGRVQDLFALGSKFAETSSESLAKLLSELGRLPDVPEARQLVEKKSQRARWTFGRMREAV